MAKLERRSAGALTSNLPHLALQKLREISERVKPLVLIPLSLLVPNSTKTTQPLTEQPIETEQVQEYPVLAFCNSSQFQQYLNQPQQPPYQLQTPANYVLEFLKWFGDKSIGTMITVAVEEMLRRRKEKAIEHQKEDNAVPEDFVLEALERLKNAPEDEEQKNRFQNVLYHYLLLDGTAAEEFRQLLAPYKQFRLQPIPLAVPPPSKTDIPPIIPHSLEEILLDSSPNPVRVPPVQRELK